MATNNLVRYGACLVASIDLLGSLLGAPAWEATAQIAVRAASAPSASGGVRRARAQLSAEQTAALLAAIPDDHPMREELRQVVREGPPDGFTAEEWLQLALKFNFRAPGSPRLRQAGSD